MKCVCCLREGGILSESVTGGFVHLGPCESFGMAIMGGVRIDQERIDGCRQRQLKVVIQATGRKELDKDLSLLRWFSNYPAAKKEKRHVMETFEQLKTSDFHINNITIRVTESVSGQYHWDIYTDKQCNIESILILGPQVGVDSKDIAFKQAVGVLKEVL